ncbi:methyltransferase domain-containing protein [Nocardia wallacei]|uniref:methyltransferase domain-containing protein n=1 Tax=Nocardia wallacei TaxID=480035 RepID=UPI0024578B69|nr:methyltransferase domain-containing protein [Nocardia wallacei]
MDIRLVARCIRGVETVVAAEILRLGVGPVVEMGHREVHFRPRRPDPAVLRLRTADDVLLSAATGPDIGSARTAVAALAELSEMVDATALLDWRRRCGGCGDLGGGVDVSASFLGGRNFARYDAEDAVGRALARRLGVGYRSRRDGAPPRDYSGWRLTLDGDRARLLLRVADRPLHRREYKRESVPGTLHPPLAAAMAQLAEIRSGERVLDPCCGAGTLLIEAARLRPDAFFRGFDRDAGAVRAARANAAEAVDVRRGDARIRRDGIPVLWGDIDLRRGDAGELPIARGDVDRILCNPPWGGQAAPRGLLAAEPTRLWPELRRVLAPGGTAVVLIPDTALLATAIAADFLPTHVQPVRVSGRQVHIARLESRHPARRRGQPHTARVAPG